MNLRMALEEKFKISLLGIIKKFVPFKKQIKKGWIKIKKIRVLLFFSDISNQKLLKVLNKGNKKQISEYFRERKPILFINPSKQIKILSLDKIIPRADKICKHIFNLLGSGDVALGEKIDWHCDFKSGYSWNPKTFYLDIKYGDKEVVDVKVPWELSRFQHLSLLGKAYWLVDDEKYAREFVNQIDDWIENNKPGFGVNWKCTMDVAIRACNWLLGYYFFKDSKEITDEFLIKFLKSLFIHGKHIERNLEKGWQGLTSNHYLSDIAGLVYLGLFFRDTKIGEKWLNFGIKELKKEMKKQVYSDGCDFETSTCYHRLVLELFFYSTFLVVMNDKNFNDKNYKEITEKIFGKEYTKKLYKMFEAVLYLLKPNGRMPQIGDNDSGQLFKLYPREVLDMRYLLAIGAVFFKEDKWKVKEFFASDEDITEILILFGEKGKEVWDSLEWSSLKNIKSRAFTDAGWYVMRDNMNYCIISCGPNGHNGNGGHTHNDKLSFELSIDGKDVIVDPGTYVYTSDYRMRNLFRNSKYHNTVVADGKEINRFNPIELFWIHNDTGGNIKTWKVGEEYIFFEGEHYGYQRFKNHITHKRQILFNKKLACWVTKDIFIGNGKHTFEFYFHFAPMNIGVLHYSKEILEKAREVGNFLNENSFDINESLVVETRKTEGPNLLVIPVNCSGVSLSIEEGWISYSYGVKTKAPVVKFAKESTCPTEFITILYPF